MSFSARKDLFHAMIIHKMPPHLSKHEFETKLEALIDEVLQLPLVQKNVLKVEMIFQQDLLDEHVKAFGFPPREPVVFVAVHCETVDNLLALLGAAEVQKVVEKGKEFGLHSNSYGFSAEVVAKHDNPALRMQHDQKFENFIDNFLSVPAVKKNFVRFEMWQHNHMLDDHIRAFGYSESGPAFIHHAIIESWDSAMEMMKDPEAQHFVMNAGNDGKDFNLKTGGYVFAGRVVTKIDKSV
ncbi:hypothetical protein C8R44DRAFT_876945 [Mycena epipterygia]|nr:hypothetical protein C8R44DRAFT_876945 [Mycena epipterygia]